jgi:NAD(P)-dependent dehydrogenase (short-subunit alcohol dehydrogenase family)
MDKPTQWNPELAQSLEDDVRRLAYLAGCLVREPGLVFAGMGGLSLKQISRDPFGDPQETLVFAGALHRDEVETAVYDLAMLQKVSMLQDPKETGLQKALGQARISPDDPLPTLDSLAHAVFAARWVALTCPTALMALDLLADGRTRIEALFGDRVLWLDQRPDLSLAGRLSECDLPESAMGVFVHRFGLFTFAETPGALFERTVSLVREVGTVDGICTEQPTAVEETPRREAIAALRQALSQAAGTPLLVRTLPTRALREMAVREGLQERLVSGPLTAHQARVFSGGFLRDAGVGDRVSPNNLLLDPELGLVVTGQCAADLRDNQALACRLLSAAARAQELGDLDDAVLAPGKALEPQPRNERDKDSMFLGEVALVTGAASGIGRGCALSLLARGAAVIGLDINPDIETLSDSPAYLGMVCDLTDESAVALAYETAVRAFGGLDMLVLNAGIFTKSALVEELEMSLWQRVMRINLDANVTILRESYPLLILAPADGRVLVNASRNVPAPGPGAAAYSTSKAGLTQLARVAALEWGPDGIRVNMIHPHAVFDTGIWTDEVLQSRAEKYGLTVKEYKTRNVLQVELTSRDIGELVCEMLGPVFSKTTGAQVPVDGGSDRVI